MSRQHILPAALRTQSALGGAIAVAADHSKGHRSALNSLSGLVSNGFNLSEELNNAIHEADRQDSERSRARFAVDSLLPKMEKLREVLDSIEGRMDAKDFPFMSYEDMI